MKTLVATLAGSAVAVALFGATGCLNPPPEQTEPVAVSEPETAPAPDQTVPETEQEPPAPEEEEGTDPPEPEVETSDTDGVFTYEVSETGTADVFHDTFGDPFHPEQDHFYVVDVTATNESEGPATAPDPWMLDHVVAVDSEGRTHQADDEPWTDDLNTNPGASVTYAVAWDLPEGVEVEYVELAAYEALDVAVIEVR